MIERFESCESISLFLSRKIYLAQNLIVTILRLDRMETAKDE